MPTSTGLLDTGINENNSSNEGELSFFEISFVHEKVL